MVESSASLASTVPTEATKATMSAVPRLNTTALKAQAAIEITSTPNAID